MKQSKTIYKRCRPLMGTFVEITCSENANKAFLAIEEVSAIMNFHDPFSDLSRLNNSIVGKWISVHKKLIEVLNLAQELERKSNGVFNVAIGGGKNSFEIKGSKVRRLQSVKIDLGGIAKGYAVDQAVKVLNKNKKAFGCVNAGGDLRVFGKPPQAVCIRTQKNNFFTKIHNQSLATSEVISGSKFSYYIKNKKTFSQKKAAVVLARECVMADALTKIALMSPIKKAEKIARHYGAELKVL